MEPQPSEAVEIFCSYAHEDEHFRVELEAHLSSLRDEGKIKSWHDRMIEPGEGWRDAIDERLETAQLILLLVSSDFINSEYCREVEMPRALARHRAGDARVIPVVLRPCDWEASPLGELQALPTGALPVTKWPTLDEAFTDVVKGVRAVVDKMLGTAPAAGKTPPSIPRAPAVGFVARRDEAGRDIVERLKAELAPGRGRFAALCGPGGVGKTTLAAEAARSLSTAFAQRVAWVGADGLPEFTLATLLDEVAAQFGQKGLRPLPVAQKAERVRALVTLRPSLVVLDNFETIKEEEQTRCAEWLGGCASCSALVTSRVDVPGARHIYIEVMTPAEAKELLEELVGQTRNQRVFRKLDHDEIIAAADRNPLVLQWVIQQISKAQRPRDVLTELTQGGGDAAQRVFDQSFHLLDDDARAALLALSLFVPSASRSALAEAAGFGADEERLNDAAAQLSEWWLAGTTEDNERLTVEGLTRELSKAHLSESEHADEFRRRFVAHFVAYARAHTKPTPEDYDALEAERDNLLSAADVAFAQKDWDNVVRIASALENPVDGMLNVRGYWDEALRIGHLALNAARSSGREKWVAVLIHNVAAMYRHRGELEEARRLYGESLEIKRRLDKQAGIAVTLNELGSLAQAQGDLDEARKFYNESLEIKRECGDERGIAVSLHNLAVMAQNQGEAEEARRLYGESLEIKRKLGDESSIAVTLHNLAVIAQNQGEAEEARRLYGESLDINRKVGDKNGIAATLHQLGSLAQAQGDFDEARKFYDESLEINKRLGNQSAIATALQQLGRLAHIQGDLGGARRLYGESLEIKKRLGRKSGIAITLHQLGKLAVDEGDKGEAARLFREALNLFEKLGSPNAEVSRRNLKRVEADAS